MRKEVELRNRRAEDSSSSSLQTETEYEQTAKHTLQTQDSILSVGVAKMAGAGVHGVQNCVEADPLAIERVKRLLALRTDQVPRAGGAPNPMLGHSETLIFSRITGHPDCPDAEQWFDAAECWVCNRHSKCSISVAHCHELQDAEFNEIIWLGAATREWAEVRQSGARGVGRLRALDEAPTESEDRSGAHNTTDTDSSGATERQGAVDGPSKEYAYLRGEIPIVE